MASMLSTFTIKFAVYSVYLCLVLCLSHCNVDGESVVITEDNIDMLFQGQWMVKFYAPWCPACRNLRPIWDKFATEAETLNINVAEVDVTKSAGLSGRFGVTSLPTIYHVMNGEFRLFKERRKFGNMVDFVEKRKWENVDTIPWWKSPNSILMKALGVVYKISVSLKDAHLFFTETYGLPDWASYVIFGVATVSIGLIIGMVLVFLTDYCIGILWPPQPIYDGQNVVNEQTEADDADEPKESEETETPVDNSNVRKRGKKLKATME